MVTKIEELFFTLQEARDDRYDWLQRGLRNYAACARALDAGEITKLDFIKAETAILQAINSRLDRQLIAR